MKIADIFTSMFGGLTKRKFRKPRRNPTNRKLYVRAFGRRFLRADIKPKQEPAPTDQRSFNRRRRDRQREAVRELRRAFEPGYGQAVRLSDIIGNY